MTVVPFLSTSKLTKTTAGQQELINAITERAELNKEFDPQDTDNLHCDRIILCTEHALPLFNVSFIFKVTCVFINIGFSCFIRLPNTLK